MTSLQHCMQSPTLSIGSPVLTTHRYATAGCIFSGSAWINSDSSSCVYSSWTHSFLIVQAWFNLVCMCTLLTDQRTHRAFQSDNFEVSSKARRWLPDRLGWEDWCSPYGLQGITTSIYQAFTILSPSFFNNKCVCQLTVRCCHPSRRCGIITLPESQHGN